ncbi:phosphatidylserine decarboxylase family protein [Streptomyces varsoviensis]|uniref:phosphatidylserine decarboxylase family protein n=1 Tax=Streptomyces varsoviensis TaxID=67373 RepID=UPI0033C4C1C3
MATDVVKQTGRWLPEDQVFLARWLDDLIEQTEEEQRTGEASGHAKVVKDFEKFVYANPEVYVLFTDMFEQLSLKETPTGYPQVKSFKQMLHLLDAIIRTTPEFIPPGSSNSAGLIGFPINVILNWAMGTQAGFAAFLNKDVNKQLKVVLNEWAKYLKSNKSKEELKRRKWLTPEALKAMADPGKKFEDLFDCKPEDAYYGFTSWNDFFTRKIRKEAPDPRPIADGDNVVASACEAFPYRLSEKVRLHRHFSIKGQPYSLAHLLDTAHRGTDEPKAEDYVDGTVYQGFLSALAYHRWHSPVKGKIKACRQIPGAYYAEAPSSLCDPAAPDISQGYISHVGTRVLIFIEADNKKLGTLCFVAIGMAEVSSCVLSVKPGDTVQKGQELGMFQYGGSSHCLVFGPSVKLSFVPEAKKIDRDNPKVIKVNAKLATLR